MYSLFLSPNERKAIDWVGNRYDHGDSLRNLLLDCLNADDEWGGDAHILFAIPESVAWEICLIAEQCEYRWDCFAPSLSLKLTNFCLSVV